ncbi:cytochrome c [Sulfitobacter sp. S0837]|uniref:c-type cytochrome n=1 Tax=Sulfitobacter maritimus TaxID=2741719 RepID=UPI001581EB92|nr:cytochrome c [Sulfitobacter maritimus]NUH64140.1 cytochrome c [Sulfitobacter maritimus]
MHLTKSITAIGLGAIMIATTGFAASHSEKAAKAAVGARHAQMQLIAYHTGILGGMAKGETDYDAEMARVAAANLHAAASLEPSSLWLEGTEQGAVEGSRAKAEIWSDMDGFTNALKTLQTASAEMMDMAGTDLDALKAGMGGVGKACGACHDDYRGPKN